MIACSLAVQAAVIPAYRRCTPSRTTVSARGGRGKFSVTDRLVPPCRHGEQRKCSRCATPLLTGRSSKANSNGGRRIQLRSFNAAADGLTNRAEAEQTGSGPLHLSSRSGNEMPMREREGEAGLLERWSLRPACGFEDEQRGAGCTSEWRFLALAHGLSERSVSGD